MELNRSGQLVLLLLGEKRSGKSSAGNSILGRQAFTKNTTCSSREDSAIYGKHVTVVDTPGWLSHTMTPDKVSQEVYRGLTLCHPELHAILLVLPTTSVFGKEELRALEAQLKMLQTPTWHRAMVLFTHADKLGAKSIQDHIKQQGQTLHWLLERCANRYQVMTNCLSSPKAQVTELLEKIQKMMETSSSRETQNILYTRLRRELGVKERTWWGRQVVEKTLNECDECDGVPGQMQQTPVCSGLALTFILLGRRKSGKSSVGNIILGREEFPINQYRQSSRCLVGRGTVSG
ncbi:GTPase IMAP family member 8-like [Halichoeres trimaculatus]|uniref:GTPase IMAP family member 8-like n=1 Tax=Halichoeres trimaculatus TaxID=147232 RepID=UPI003D9F4C95